MSEISFSTYTSQMGEDPASFMCVDDSVSFSSSEDTTTSLPLTPKTVTPSFGNSVELNRIIHGKNPRELPKDQEVLVWPMALGSVGDTLGADPEGIVIRELQRTLVDLTKKYQTTLRYLAFKNLLKADPKQIQEIIKKALIRAELTDLIPEWTVGIESVLEHFRNHGIDRTQFEELLQRAQIEPTLSAFARSVQIGLLLLNPNQVSGNRELDELNEKIIEAIRQPLLALMEGGSSPAELATKIAKLKPSFDEHGAHKLDGSTFSDIARRNGVSHSNDKLETLESRCAMAALQIAQGKVHEGYIHEVISMLYKLDNPDRSTLNRVAVREPIGVPGFSGEARVVVSMPGRPATAFKSEPIVLPAIFAPRLGSTTFPSTRFPTPPLSYPADRQAGLGAIHIVADPSDSDLDIIPIPSFLGYYEYQLLRRGGFLHPVGVSLTRGVGTFIGKTAVTPSDRQAGLGSIPIVANPSTLDLDIIPILPIFGYAQWRWLERAGSNLGNGLRNFFGKSATPSAAGLGIFPILVLPGSYPLLREQSQRAQGRVDGPT